MARVGDGEASAGDGVTFAVGEGCAVRDGVNVAGAVVAVGRALVGVLVTTRVAECVGDGCVVGTIVFVAVTLGVGSLVGIDVGYTITRVGVGRRGTRRGRGVLIGMLASVGTAVSVGTSVSVGTAVSVTVSVGVAVLAWVGVAVGDVAGVAV